MGSIAKMPPLPLRSDASDPHLLQYDQNDNPSLFLLANEQSYEMREPCTTLVPCQPSRLIDPTNIPIEDL